MLVIVRYTSITLFGVALYMSQIWSLHRRRRPVSNFPAYGTKSWVVLLFSVVSRLAAHFLSILEGWASLSSNSSSRTCNSSAPQTLSFILLVFLSPSIFYHNLPADIFKDGFFSFRVRKWIVRATQKGRVVAEKCIEHCKQLARCLPQSIQIRFQVAYPVWKHFRSRSIWLLQKHVSFKFLVKNGSLYVHLMQLQVPDRYNSVVNFTTEGKVLL